MPIQKHEGGMQSHMGEVHPVAPVPAMIACPGGDMDCHGLVSHKGMRQDGLYPLALL